MVASLLHSKRPEDLKLILIDPKCTEFQIYRDLSGSNGHDVSVITKAIDAANTLEELDEEVDRRYDSEEKHPYIVCFINEYADLTVSFRDRESKALSRRIMTAIIRIAQRGRGVGIHMVIATQRPTVDVITGLIKAHFPTRIAFRTASRIDSATILDQPGAEKLIGNGDLLYACGVELERLQAGYIDQS